MLNGGGQLAVWLPAPNLALPLTVSVTLGGILVCGVGR